MKKFIVSNLQGKRILILFLITNAVYAIMLLISIPHVMSFAKGMKLLDMMPTGYSPEYVSDLFNSLGEAGRDAYLYNQLPWDMVYPFLFGIANCLLMAWVLNKLGKLNGGWYYLCLIPLFSGIFDYGENLGIISMLVTYPGYSMLQVKVTSVFSVLKSFSTTLFFTTLIVCLIWFGVLVLRKRSKASVS